MSTVESSLITAEQYASLPDPGHPTELIEGEIVAVNMPRFHHGVLCRRVAKIIGNYVDDHQLGWVLTNDSGVITKRRPDTVRGAGVAFYSYLSLPMDRMPDKYAPCPPELVFEVKSQDDRWPAIQEKIAEYLKAGVQAVGVLDPDTESLAVYHAGRPVESLTAGDKFKVSEILPGFVVEVGEFFV